MWLTNYFFINSLVYFHVVSDTGGLIAGGLVAGSVSVWTCNRAWVGGGSGNLKNYLFSNSTLGLG